jgi:hypothetical protein
MNKLELLSEYVRRNLKKTLLSNSIDREADKVKKLLFLKKVHESDGKYLLDFISINEKHPLIDRKLVFDFIRYKSESNLSTQQLAYIRSYMEKLGAVVIKRNDKYYFKNVKLKL